MPGATRSCEGQGRLLLWRLWRDHDCQHLDFRVLVSVTVRQYISVVLAIRFEVLCYGGPGRLPLLRSAWCPPWPPQEAGRLEPVGEQSSSLSSTRGRTPSQSESSGGAASKEWGPRHRVYMWRSGWTFCADICLFLIAFWEVINVYIDIKIER